MSIRNLDHLLQPKTIALIGASSHPESMGAIIWANLNAGKFQGSLYPVNLKYKFLDYAQVYKHVIELPETIDLAVICTPPETVAPLIREMALAKVKSVLVVTKGLTESQTRDMLNSAKPQLMRVLGSNSIGVLTPKIGLNASLYPTDSIAGDLAFISQSGAISTAVLDWARFRGIGFSHLISLGESSDVDMADLLDALGSDSGTKAILLYAESIQSARKFMSAARAAARNKPVIILKAGSASDSSQGIMNAAFSRAGMLRVSTMQQLFTAAMALTRRGDPKSTGLTILSNAHGASQMAADFANNEDIALTLVEIDGKNIVERYNKELQNVLSGNTGSMILLMHSPMASAAGKEIALTSIDAIGDHKNRVMSCWLGEESTHEARDIFRRAGIADYETPEEAVSAFSMMRTYWRNQALLMEAPASFTSQLLPNVSDVRVAICEALASGRDTLSTVEVGALLNLYGIKTPELLDVSVIDQASKAIEILVGAYVDPLFGPVVTLGAMNGDKGKRSIGLPPLNSILASEMIINSGVVFDELGREAVCLALMAISSMLAHIPEIVELEIKPLRANSDGVLAMAASVTISSLKPAGAKNFAILPYPEELIESVLWRGENIMLRPIRPEDEAQHRHFLEQLTPEDIRMRIFFTKRELSRSELARLTQIDYDREMAFIAERDIENGVRQTLAVVRVVADPDGYSAEFALVVRSDLKRQGLGRLMLDKAIAYSRKKGLHQLVGSVLRENNAMKELTSRAGFVSDSSIPMEREASNVILVLKQ
jgi:acetyltransferase